MLIRSHRRFSVALALILLTALTVGAGATGSASAAPEKASSASGFRFFKFLSPRPVCSGFGLDTAPTFAYDRADCGFVIFKMSGAPENAGKTGGTAVEARFYKPGTTQVFATAPVTSRPAEGEFGFNIRPDTGCPTTTPPTTCTWPAGEIDFEIWVKNETAPAGAALFRFNYLGASVRIDAVDRKPGDPIDVGGELYELDSVAANAGTDLAPGTSEKRPVAGTFFLEVSIPDADGTAVVKGPYGQGGCTKGAAGCQPFTANGDNENGKIKATVPGEATKDVTATAETGFTTVVSVSVVDTSYTDPMTGQWASERAGSAPADIKVPVNTLLLENSFVSSVGWVKPGETYPFRIFVRNFMETDATGAKVTLAAPDGTKFTKAQAAGMGPVPVAADGTTITWQVGTVEAGKTKSLVAEGRADCVVQDQADQVGPCLDVDRKIVWKNLSAEAVLTYDGYNGDIRSSSHGPKVIPQDTRFDTARYGDRPFPVVPVDYQDRKHASDHSGELLASKINSKDIPGSTFNLFQEISYGQLFPNGTVPSAGIATADFEGFESKKFTVLRPQGTCKGATYKDFAGSPIYEERIRDGWYQMPGDTEYYGGDRFGSALVGAVGGIGPIFQIDDACGPTGKAVYDAAVIADPEIDYSDYDTDKDGVVDFFMMVFVGLGGNGASQIDGTPPYDNIWPHSSSLEFYYSSAEGDGYVSDDQLKDLEGNKLYWTDAGRSEKTTTVTAFPVKVRVGPYNVNPESAIDNASVISHEYGHSLGLPDYYSLGNRDTYGDWNLMATDKSQNMDIIPKVELGWTVPRVLEPGERNVVRGWKDSKKDIHEIEWRTPPTNEFPEGEPYTLQGPTVHNGEAYVAKLPSRAIIDPKKVAEGASPDRLWWSESGNDFGCTPTGGHNLDIFLPELADLEATDKVTATFKSYWDIEWDYDYGFVMYSVDDPVQSKKLGDEYVAMESERGYTTPATSNPNANACQAKYGNGITGTSGSYKAGTEGTDRLLGNYPDGPFLEDEYDLTEAVGKETVLRFSYSTDPGLARPGWFIDDLKVTVNKGTPSEKVIYDTNFESADDERLYNGGCTDDTKTASLCTDGWSQINVAQGSPADHAYYMEMRDRSGFDLDGHGENDRGLIGFDPGLLLTYTDESHGYGNVGTSDPPAQSPLDSQPQPGNNSPTLDDAAYTAAERDTAFSDFLPQGHTDNYKDPSSESGNWEFKYDCLSFDVLTMTGNEDGPEFPAPNGNNPEGTYDLNGEVRFTMGTGCGKFDYGFVGGGEEDQGPPEPPSEQCEVTGTMGDDIIRGSSKDEVICALAGDDKVYGGGGDDTILAARGNDTVYGQGGNDTVYGGWGSDSIRGQSGRDTIEGEGANDTIDGGVANDTLKGGIGSDTILGNWGDDSIRGESGRDNIRGEGGDDTIDGGVANDTLKGGSDADTILGNWGDDSIQGETGRDNIRGEQGDDTIDGGLRQDNLRGGLGRDSIVGSFGDDLIGGGPGADTLKGNQDNDAIRGGGHNDILRGGMQDDVLYGESGDDTLAGGPGRDDLYGGTGSDVCRRGSGDTARRC